MQHLVIVTASSIISAPTVTVTVQSVSRYVSSLYVVHYIATCFAVRGFLLKENFCQTLNNVKLCLMKHSSVFNRL